MKRLFVLFAACGGDSQSMPDALAIDAAPDAASFSTCEGACRQTQVIAEFNAMRVMSRAYYGITQSDQTLHVEAYTNAPAGCPTMNSPNPDYTLILGRVTKPVDTTPGTSPGNILDFKGDLLGGPLGAQATMVTIAPAAAGDDFVALDVMLTFQNGTVRGHLYATHCASMDS